jgi:O-antigen ligase
MLVGLTLVLIPYYVSLNAVINILIFVSSVNSIAIIGQFLDIGFFWVLADILTLFSEHAVYDLTTLTRIKGVYLGLVGAVQSGYLLSLLVPLILYKISLRKNRIFWLCFLVINLFVASLVQQRLAFALIIFNISYYIWTIKISKISLLTLVVLFFIVFLSMDFSDLIGDSSRLNTFSDDNRLSLFSTCIIFIINNPIFGGFNSYYLILETSPHNILFNAWIRGGFFGFLAIIIMISIILRKSFRILIDKNIKTPLNNYITLALVNIILISFTHNEGITTYHGFNYILITLFVIINSLPKIDSNSFQEKGSYIKNY